MVAQHSRRSTARKGIPAQHRPATPAAKGAAEAPGPYWPSALARAGFLSLRNAFEAYPWASPRQGASLEPIGNRRLTSLRPCSGLAFAPRQGCGIAASLPQEKWGEGAAQRLRETFLAMSRRDVPRSWLALLIPCLGAGTRTPIDRAVEQWLAVAAVGVAVGVGRLLWPCSFSRRFRVRTRIGIRLRVSVRRSVHRSAFHRSDRRGGRRDAA